MGFSYEKNRWLNCLNFVTTLGLAI